MYFFSYEPNIHRKSEHSKPYAPAESKLNLSLSRPLSNRAKPYLNTKPTSSKMDIYNYKRYS